MKRLSLILVILFVCALGGGYWLAGKTPGGLKLDSYAPAPPGGDFQLSSVEGPVRLSDFQNQLVLIYFGYTHCPDICPTALALTTGALNQLSPQELEQVQTLFISIDPKRDTAQRMADYANFLSSRHHRPDGQPRTNR